MPLGSGGFLPQIKSSKIPNLQEQAYENVEKNINDIEMVCSKIDGSNTSSLNSYG